MLYNAIDIAKYIIDYCNKNKRLVSNLKLQKMLYYVWIDYYKKSSFPLFNEDFCAWTFGPVIPDVYYEFCSYAGSPIIKNFNLEFSNDLEKINEIIDKYMDKSPYELVQMSHKKDYPWDIVYNRYGNRAIIPFSLIVSLECGNNDIK